MALRGIINMTTIVIKSKLYWWVPLFSSWALFLLFPVTIARAIELKHNATIIAALAFETANFYQKAGQWFGTSVKVLHSVLLITSLSLLNSARPFWGEILRNHCKGCVSCFTWRQKSSVELQVWAVFNLIALHTGWIASCTISTVTA